MKFNKNKFFRQLHIYLSLFFLPCALIYAISGIAFLCDLEDFGLSHEEFRVEGELTQNNEREILLKILRANDIKIPRDTALREDLNDPGFRMGSLIYSIYAEQSAPSEILIIAEKRNVLGILMGLHENEGRAYFMIAAFGFALVLLMLYISGFVITLLASKKERKIQLLTILCDFVFFAVLGILSAVQGFRFARDSRGFVHKSKKQSKKS